MRAGLKGDMKISVIPLLLLVAMAAAVIPNLLHRPGFLAPKPEPMQPRSVIDQKGPEYAAIDDPSTNLHETTKTRPLPRDPGDRPSGLPIYHWDFGPLHGKDNGDGSATIFTDVAGDYEVRVYCEQAFIDANGNLYTERTLTSE